MEDAAAYDAMFRQECWLKMQPETDQTTNEENYSNYTESFEKILADIEISEYNQI